MKMRDQVPKRSETFSVKPLGNEIMLFNEETKAVHTLNVTASFVWNLCDGNHTVDEIFKAMKEKFDYRDTQKMREDLIRLILSFEEKEIIEKLER